MASTSMGAVPGKRGGTGRRSYFALLFGLLFLLTLVAFWDNIVSDVSQPSNSDPKMVVHALFASAWIIILIAQALLIRSRRHDLHRRVGTASLAIAIGSIASTVVLFVAKWKSWHLMEPEVQANRILLPSFALCILLAWWWRRRADWHKRLVTVGTLFLLEPILARTFDPLVAPLLPPMAPGEDMPIFYGFMIATWGGLFASLMAYDLTKLGRIHRVSLIGFGWVVLVYLFVFLT